MGRTLSIDLRPGKPATRSKNPRRVAEAEAAKTAFLAQPGAAITIANPDLPAPARRVVEKALAPPRSPLERMIDDACGVQAGGGLDPATRAFLTEERKRQREEDEALLEAVRELFPVPRGRLDPPSLLTTSCVCARPGGQEARTMDRRRACMSATKNKTPCRCSCHGPGVRYFGAPGGVQITPGWEVDVDDGVLTPVLVLLLAGVDVVESCEGGACPRDHTHSKQPYARFRGGLHSGLVAREALAEAGVKLVELRRVWPGSGTPYPFWEVTLTD